MDIGTVIMVILLTVVDITLTMVMDTQLTTDQEEAEVEERMFRVQEAEVRVERLLQHQKLLLPVVVPILQGVQEELLQQRELQLMRVLALLRRQGLKIEDSQQLVGQKLHRSQE